MPAHIQRQATCSGLILAAATVLAFAANSSAQPAPRVTPSDLQGLTWRAIGPAVMSGRVTAVAGVPGNPRIIYVAHASGGLFKSVDGGVTFRSTFDQGGTLSIGALAVSPIAGRPVALFKPMAAVRFVRTPATARHGQRTFEAPNKPYGAIISYYLACGEGQKSEMVSLEVSDPAEKLLRTLSGTGHAGVNRIAWDLRENPPGGSSVVQDSRSDYVLFPLTLRGPEVLPGAYTVRLIARGETLFTPLTVRADPRWKFTPEEFASHQRAGSTD